MTHDIDIENYEAHADSTDMRRKAEKENPNDELERIANDELERIARKAVDRHAETLKRLADQ